jgi:hypothetical protein
MPALDKVAHKRTSKRDHCVADSIDDDDRSHAATVETPPQIAGSTMRAGSVSRIARSPRPRRSVTIS